MSLEAPRWVIQRLSARLVKSVDMLASIPGQPITGNPEGDRAAVKGYYRMIDQPEESAVTPENILAPHRARTVQRMRDQNTVLCIQDGTDLNFATRPACGGLEIIGRNQTSAKTRGLHLHLTLATTGEGLPLGILRCGFDPPKASGAGSEAKHANATQPGPEPRAGKDAKTQRWIQGLQDAGRVARELTGKTRVIGVMDREADFYELFDEQRRIGRVEVLVRARHNRILENGAPKLFAALRNQLPGGQVEIEIDRLTERPKSSRKEARPARSKRRARVEVRFRRFDLPSTIPGTQPVPMSVVHLRETNPPDGEKPLEWFLLTSLPVDHFDAAVEIIGFYLRRWRIEDLFRVLKSGCKVEDRRLPLRVPLAARRHHRCRHRMAHHAHDPARPRSARMPGRTDVYRQRNPLPRGLCKQLRSRHAPEPGRRRPPRRNPRRVPEPKTRSPARKPDHVARDRTTGHRKPRIPRRSGAKRRTTTCPERIVGTR